MATLSIILFLILFRSMNEEKIASMLHVPYLGCNPRLSFWGTKQGSRQIFKNSNVPHPAGKIFLPKNSDLFLDLFMH